MSFRDVVLQFDPALILRAAQVFPEFSDLASFLKAAKRGLQFHGRTAQLGAVLMERIGKVEGYQRLTLFLELMRCLAWSSERSFLARIDYEPSLDHTSSPLVHEVISYILANLATEVRMSEAARIAGMSEPSFSRFFKKNTGNNFVDCVRKLRIGQACRLLSKTRTPVTEICFEVGYNNISNFNRHFLSECGVTPSRYRNLAGNRTAPQALSQNSH
jgi:AraC-like DNA-binding protein